MNSPNRYGGGTGYFHGKQQKSDDETTASITVFVVLFFVFLMGLVAAFENNKKPVTDENGCYSKGRFGLYCPPDTKK